MTKLLFNRLISILFNDVRFSSFSILKKKQRHYFTIPKGILQNKIFLNPVLNPNKEEHNLDKQINSD